VASSSALKPRIHRTAVSIFRKTGRRIDFMTVLVTGGAGYIGSHMVRALVDANERVVVIEIFRPVFRLSCPGAWRCSSATRAMKISSKA
jgi:hypothetical protein